MKNASADSNKIGSNVELHMIVVSWIGFGSCEVRRLTRPYLPAFYQSGCPSNPPVYYPFILSGRCGNAPSKSKVSFPKTQRRALVPGGCQPNALSITLTWHFWINKHAGTQWPTKRTRINSASFFLINIWNKWENLRFTRWISRGEKEAKKKKKTEAEESRIVDRGTKKFSSDCKIYLSNSSL